MVNFNYFVIFFSDLKAENLLLDKDMNIKVGHLFVYIQKKGKIVANYVYFCNYKN